MSVSISVNADQTRETFRFCHLKGNAITAEMIAELRAAVADAGRNSKLKLVTIEGSGPDFSFGASIPEHAPDKIADVLPEMHRLIDDLLNLPAPTAAVVRGRCLGGGFELALACDFIFAADDAQFGLPEIRLGVFPPGAAARFRFAWERHEPRGRSSPARFSPRPFGAPPASWSLRRPPIRSTMP